jgi:hypothetical protein
MPAQPMETVNQSEIDWQYQCQEGVCDNIFCVQCGRAATRGVIALPYLDEANLDEA